MKGRYPLAFKSRRIRARPFDSRISASEFDPVLATFPRNYDDRTSGIVVQMDTHVAALPSEVSSTTKATIEFRPSFRSTGLLVPTLLPDELADTYFDAIVTANDHQSRSESIAELSRIDPDLGTLPIPVLLARICSMPVVDLVRFHCLTPFQRAFVLSKTGQYAHGSDVGGHLRSGVMRSLRNSLYLCKACADEDRRFWGRSYWRRSHQVPGIDRCDKHELPLYEVPRQRLNRPGFRGGHLN
jgi:hypothetical protein